MSKRSPASRSQTGLLSALRRIADVCEATMAHSDKVRDEQYAGRRDPKAQAMYNRVKRVTKAARAVIAKAEGRDA